MHFLPQCCSLYSLLKERRLPFFNILHDICCSLFSINYVLSIKDSYLLSFCADVHQLEVNRKRRCRIVKVDFADVDIAEDCFLLLSVKDVVVAKTW